MQNKNTQSYWDKVFSGEIRKEEWRRYPVGFNKIKTYLGLTAKANDTILDVGCGYGVLADLLRPLGCDITGWDISEVAIRAMRRKGYQGRCIDFNRFDPSREDTFAHVVATEFLEHVENPEAELAKLYRIAQKNVILTVPNRESPSERSDEHLHSFDKAKIEYLARNLPAKRLYIEEYLEEFFFLGSDGRFKLVKTPNLLVILRKPVESSGADSLSRKRADFRNHPVDICVCTFSSDHTEAGDHFGLITRCLLSIVNNTDPRLYTLHIGCNNLSLRAMAFVDWLVSCYGAQKYIGQPCLDGNGQPIYPKYPLMRAIYAASRADWVIWFDDDCYVSAGDWLERLETRINATPAADQFGDTSVIVTSLDHRRHWIEPAVWYTPGKIEYRDFPEGKKIVAPFIRGGFYAISRTAIEACDIPDRRLVHNNGDWTTGMALHHRGFKIADHLYGVTIGDEPRRGIHEDKCCQSGEADAKKLQSEKSAVHHLLTALGR